MTKRLAPKSVVSVKLFVTDIDKLKRLAELQNLAVNALAETILLDYINNADELSFLKLKRSKLLREVNDLDQQIREVKKIDG